MNLLTCPQPIALPLASQSYLTCLGFPLDLGQQVPWRSCGLRAFSLGLGEGVQAKQVGPQPSPAPARAAPFLFCPSTSVLSKIQKGPLVWTTKSTSKSWPSPTRRGNNSELREKTRARGLTKLPPGSKSPASWPRAVAPPALCCSKRDSRAPGRLRHSSGGARG